MVGCRVSLPLPKKNEVLLIVPFHLPSTARTLVVVTIIAVGVVVGPGPVRIRLPGLDISRGPTVGCGPIRVCVIRRPPFVLNLCEGLVASEALSLVP